MTVNAYNIHRNHTACAFLSHLQTPHHTFSLKQVTFLKKRKKSSSDTYINNGMFFYKPIHVEFHKPARALKSVDFPDLAGPIMTVIVPGNA